MFLRTIFFNTNILQTLKNLLKRLKMPKTINLRYFKIEEFDSPDEPGSGKKMDKEFLIKLDYARHNAGIPFVLSSAYRTRARNTLCGGRWGSSHLKGLAVDILFRGSRECFLIVKSLIDVGINRIGISKKGGFIHCDVDNSKDQDVIWLYN